MGVHSPEQLATIQRKYDAIRTVLNERARRLWAASEAMAIGHGGIVCVAKATGIGRRTIWSGIAELNAGTSEDGSESEQETGARLRRAGGGRKRLVDAQPGLLRDLETTVESTTRGDPQSPLRWTCKSLRTLAIELGKKGYSISAPTVNDLLEDLGYSLQGTRKSREGSSHPDRNAQFEYINKMCKGFQRRGQPVISVDSKKKEHVGDFKNAGREWRRKRTAPRVRVYDFVDPKLGKVTPYGVYDISKNVGWVNVGIDHDTAEFAVESIRRWWRQMGRRAYPNAGELLITADGGGSNAVKNRLWKYSLQHLADESGLRISVCHFPPGTSKWNKIEHRLFCHITQNWRGQPLVSHDVIVQLIGSTRTRKGLRVRAAIDRHEYPKGIEVTDEQMNKINLKPAKFHGDWNYSIAPQKK